MKLRTWHFENAVVVSALVGLALWLGLPPTAKTLGWGLGALAAHSLRSHGARKAEKAGTPPDLLTDALTWMLGASALLAADDAARALLVPPLVLGILFTCWRLAYRRWVKPLPARRSRVAAADLRIYETAVGLFLYFDAKDLDAVEAQDVGSELHRKARHIEAVHEDGQAKVLKGYDMPTGIIPVSTETDVVRRFEAVRSERHTLAARIHGEGQRS